MDSKSPDSPTLPEKKLRPAIWLALSGGGFRAALFQYGFVKRLWEKGLLRYVVGISATSGGAFVAALLAKHAKLVDSPAKRDTAARDPLSSRHRGQLFSSWEPFYDFDWEEFESDLLRLVTRGVLWPWPWLATARVCYWMLELSAAILGARALLGSSLAFFHAVFRDWPMISLPGAFATLWTTAYGSFQLYGQLYVRPLLLILAVGLASHAVLLLYLVHESFSAFVRWAPSVIWDHSSLRGFILDVRAFGERTMAQLQDCPDVYITSVDLNYGDEIVEAPVDDAPGDSIVATVTELARAEGMGPSAQLRITTLSETQDRRIPILPVGVPSPERLPAERLRKDRRSWRLAGPSGSLRPVSTRI